MTQARTIILYFAILAVCIGLAWQKLASDQVTIKSDILSLLGKASIVDDKIKQSASAQQQNLVIVVSSVQKSIAKERSQQLNNQLSKIPAIATVTQLPYNSEQLNKLIGFYADKPFSLLNQDYQQALAQTSQQQQAAQLNQLFLASLLQPGDPFIPLTIEYDPTLALSNAIREHFNKTSNWSNDGNVLYQQVSNEQQPQFYYPIFITLANANLGVNQSVAIANEIEHAIEQIDPQSIDIYRSGLLFHISDSTQLAQQEIGLFSSLSAFIILLTTLIVFRSIAPLLVISLVMLIAITLGGAGLTIVVNELHLITFIFAISLIGISVDYGFHLLCASQAGKEKTKTLAGYLLPAMLMGAATTILGYCVMLLMPIDALKQITIFMIFGIIGALTTALMLLAPFFTRHPVKTNQGLQQKLNQLAIFIAPLRQTQYLLVAAGLIIIGFIATQTHLKFNDDVKSLNSSDPALFAQEQKIQQLMGFTGYPRYVLVRQKTPQQLLELMGQVTTTIEPHLNQYNSDAKIQSISQWIPSESQQQHNKTKLKALIVSEQFTALNDYMEPQQIQQLQAQLEQHLQPQDWPQSLQMIAQPIWQHEDISYGLIRYFGELPPAVTKELQNQFSVEGKIENTAATDSKSYLIEPVSFFDQPKRLTQSLSDVRFYMSLFFVVGSLCFSLMLMYRYSLKFGLLAALTPICSALGALLLCQLFIGDLTIFNLLSCLLITALAIDYIVFFNEQGHQPHVIQAILLSAISSIAAFGMMSFSQTPAVYQFGLTTFIGVLLAVIFSIITPLSKEKVLNESKL